MRLGKQFIHINDPKNNIDINTIRKSMNNFNNDQHIIK